MTKNDSNGNNQKIGCLVLSPKELNDYVLSSPSSSSTVPATANQTLRKDSNGEIVLFQKAAKNDKEMCQINKRFSLFKRNRNQTTQEVVEIQVPFESLDDTVKNLNTYLLKEKLQGKCFDFKIVIQSYFVKDFF